MEVACKSNGDCVNGLLRDNKLENPSTSHLTADLTGDTTPKSEASTVFLQLEEMEEEEEQFFDVSDETESSLLSSDSSKNFNSSCDPIPGPSGIQLQRSEKLSPPSKNAKVSGHNLNDVSTEEESNTSDDDDEKAVYTIDSDSDDGPAKMSTQPADNKKAIKMIVNGSEGTEKLSDSDNKIEEVTLDSEKDVGKNVKIVNNEGCENAENQKEVKVIETSNLDNESKNKQIIDDDNFSTPENEIETEVLVEDSEQIDELSHRNSLKHEKEIESEVLANDPEQTDKLSIGSDLSNKSVEPAANTNVVTVEVHVENIERAEYGITETETPEEKSKELGIGSVDSQNEIHTHAPEKDEIVDANAEKIDVGIQDTGSSTQDTPSLFERRIPAIEISEPSAVNEGDHQLPTSEEKLNEECINQSLDMNDEGEDLENAVTVNGVVPSFSKSKNVLKELNCDPLSIKERQEEEKKFALCCPCLVVLPLLNLDNVANLLRSSAIDGASDSQKTRKRSHPASDSERPRSRRAEKSLVCDKRSKRISDISSDTEKFSLPIVRLTRISSNVQLSNIKLPIKSERTDKKRLQTVDSAETKLPTKIQKFYKSAKKSYVGNDAAKLSSSVTRSYGIRPKNATRSSRSTVN